MLWAITSQTDTRQTDQSVMEVISSQEKKKKKGDQIYFKFF